VTALSCAWPRGLNAEGVRSDRFVPLRRFLLWSPWIIVLELAFLATLWIIEPNVVPEPATGFVSGIFSWEKWYWTCWLNHPWLLRAVAPSAIVTLVYLRSVLNVNRWFAVVLTPLFIPPAIMLSIAWSVAFNQILLIFA
jgi:hypothetical protein